MMIDCYSEHILNPNQTGAVGTLPDGMDRDEFLFRLNVLLEETFPEMTSHSKQEYHSGKALLLLVKKYCFNSKVVGNAPKTPGFTEYFNATEKILDEEISRMSPAEDGTIPALDKDKAFTVISNIMQLLTSVILQQEKQKAKEEKNAQPAVLGIKIPFVGGAPVDPVDFVREDTSVANIPEYLDNKLEITKRFFAAKANPKNACEAFMDWNEFKYLKIILQITKMRLDEIGVF